MQKVTRVDAIGSLHVLVHRFSPEKNNMIIVKHG